jgi:hypothetical protein
MALKPLLSAEINHKNKLNLNYFGMATRNKNNRYNT